MLRFFFPIWTLFVVLLPLTAKSAVCVEDNQNNCDKLGYTQASCNHGGIACPFNPAKWYCTPWTCDDGRLFKTSNTKQYTSCTSTKYKDLDCYNCSCEMPSTECVIGDVFYADGTCSAVYAKCIGKQPVGVVYMLTDAAGNLTSATTSNHGRVINLKDLTLDDEYAFDSKAPYEGSYNVIWGAYGQHITGLNKYSYDAIVTAFKDSLQKEGQSQLYRGILNTSKINQTTLARCSYEGGTKEYAIYCNQTATKAAASFYPTISLYLTAVGIGRWYLPAIGELEHLYGFNPAQITSGTGNTGCTGKTKALVNKTLKDLASKGIPAEALSEDYYWSSTLTQDNSYAWVVRMSDGMRSHGTKDKMFHVRASLTF